MGTDFIDDGYTEQGNIAAQEGIHGALTFQFRPLLAAKRDVALRHMGTEKQTAELSKVLAEQLVSWSLTDANGNTVPLSADRIRRVRPALLDKLFAIVANLRSSDTCPEEAATLREVADAKN